MCSTHRKLETPGAAPGELLTCRAAAGSTAQPSMDLTACLLVALVMHTYQARCAEVGNHLVRRLGELQAKHDIIGDVRGKGLMLGVEFVKDRTTKVGRSVMAGCRDQGMFWSAGRYAYVPSS